MWGGVEIPNREKETMLGRADKRTQIMPNQNAMIKIEDVKVSKPK